MSWGLRRGARAVLVVLTAVLGVVVQALPAQALVEFDDTPQAGWGVNGRVYASVILGDTVVVGGNFTAAVSPSGTTVAKKNLAAFSMSTGELLTGWTANAGSEVRALATDGTSIYAGGAFSKVNNKAAVHIARLDATTGVLDQTFLASAAGNVRALAVDGTSLYAGGAFTTAGGQARTRLAKFDLVTGALDPAFQASANGDVWGLARNPSNDTLYVSGKFSTLSGATRTGVGGVSSLTGSATGVTFASSAKPTYGLVTNEDGSMLFGAGGSSSNAAAAWNTTSGTRVWRQVTDGDIQAIAYYHGTVYFGFHDGFRSDPTVKLLAANSQTGVLQSFTPRFDAFWGVFALAAGPNGLVAGGDFTQIDGVSTPGFARFPTLASPRPDPVSQTFVSAGSTWSYWDQNSRPTGWEKPPTDLTGWESGLGELGYGGVQTTTIDNTGPTAYFRTDFTVNEIPTDRVELDLLAEDGAVVYVNGVQLLKDNMPDGTISHTTLALTNRTAGQADALRPFSINPAILRTGTNTLAVEVHKYSATAGGLGLDAELTGYYQN